MSQQTKDLFFYVFRSVLALVVGAYFMKLIKAWGLI